MDEGLLHVMDFEGSRATGVVEAGVVTLRAGEIVATFSETYLPVRTIPAAERACHGLGEDELAEKPPFAESFGRFRDLRASGLFGAHHAVVEDSFLRQVWPCPPLSPGFVDGSPLASWGPWLDTRRIAEKLLPGLESYALSELIATFEVGEELARSAQRYCPPGRRKAHCALYDALASALLFLRMRREQPGASWADWVAWSVPLAVSPQSELFG